MHIHYRNICNHMYTQPYTILMVRKSVVHQLRLVVSLIIYKRWFATFLPSTVLAIHIYIYNHITLLDVKLAVTTQDVVKLLCPETRVDSETI